MKMGLKLLLLVILMTTVCSGRHHFHRSRSSDVPPLPSIATLFSNCQKSIATPRRCDFGSPFRTIESTCNNRRRRTLGATNTTLFRLIGSVYAAGTKGGIPRGFPGTKERLPTANQVSRGVFRALRRNSQRTRLGVSVMYMTFGQFVDHDLTLVDHSSSCDTARCRTETNPFAYPCFPIRFSRNGRRCTPNGRSLPQCESRRSGGREFNNRISAFIDSANVYSHEPDLLQSLRTNDGTGRLRLTGNLLPLRTTNCMRENGCSLVGEERGDENAPLNTMHTLWVREHNRIASNLKKVNPNWGEESLFQHSRKIVGAIFQHIVYNEFVPLLAKLNRYTGYKSSVNPSISNAFANAAFRFGHTLIPNSLARLNKNFDHAKSDLLLQASFRNILPAREDGIEPLMFGLLKNQSQDFDTDFAFGIARRLFVPVGSNGYRDLTALNIQRGRDHGLPTYGAFRRFCKLKPVTSFSQLRGIIRSSAISKLKRLYSSPNEIDLFAAGSSEIPLKGKLLGPTFSCLVKDQFERTRDGDRFFYQRRAVFNPAQINEIKKVTFARVLCDNLKDIVSVQRDVFQALNNGKKRVECGNIRGIDFTMWKVSGESGSSKVTTTVKPQPGKYYHRRYSPRRYSPRRYSPRRYSPRRYPPRRYSARRYSPRRYSPRRQFGGRSSRGYRFG